MTIPHHLRSLFRIVVILCVGFPNLHAQESEQGSLTIGAYYYPWYSAAEPGETGWMSKALRGRLKPQQLPKLGVYGSEDPEVIGTHIAQSVQAGLDFWAVSWWGPGKREDRTFREHILTHADAGKLKYAALYESTGRLGSMRNPKYDNLISDFAHLKKHYFDHPAYLKIDGKPVVFIYLTRVYFRDRGLEPLAELRKAFPDLYLIGDDVFGDRYHERHAKLWNAVTAYDVYGQSMQRHGATQAAAKQLHRNYANAKKIANGVGTAFIPAVAPGYNDRAVRKGHAGRARYFTDAEDSKEGDIFRSMIRDIAVPLADTKANRTIMVTSFNEWYEDTQIEPTVGSAETTTTDDSESGTFYAESDRYVDYGTLYLDILREEKEAVAAQETREAFDKIEESKAPVKFEPIHPESMKFEQPVWFSPIPGTDGKEVVLEHRKAKAWVLHRKTGSIATEKTLFADWNEQVSDGPWEGLMCIAFHPDYANNRRFFVKHETIEDGQRYTVVVEKRSTEDLISDSGEVNRILLKIKQPADNHNGGTAAFGPDGFLYVAMGDGGPQEDPNGYTQSGNSFLGKMLRIDVDKNPTGAGNESALPYAIPNDNPFVERDPEEWHHEIWALGFREPWRFSFDRKDGALWLGDVGQVRFEEVVVVKSGENHGWNVEEGFEGFSEKRKRDGETYVPPVLAYGRPLGNSITGGYVYRGKQNSEFEGAYVFGDFTFRHVWAIQHEGGKLRKVVKIGMAPELISSFGEDGNGELYVVGYGGTVYSIDFAGARMEE